MDIAIQRDEPCRPNSDAGGGAMETLSPPPAGGRPASGNGAASGPVTDTILDILYTQLQPTTGNRGEITYHGLTDYEKKVKRKRGRYYHALVSGLEWNKKKDLRFLTLTSPVGAQPIQISWHGFLAVMHKTTVGTLLAGGYLTKYQIENFYDGRKLSDPLDFEYLALVTSEGNGVLHIVTAGDFLPVSFLREHWNRIHGGSAGYKGNVQLKIERIHYGSESYHKLTKYLSIGQYLKNQDKFVRFSASKGWLFPRYRTLWRGLIKQRGFSLALLQWQYMMAEHILPTYQSKLNGEAMAGLTMEV